ncbi:FAD-binding oxidoreductase [Protaetiibacter larvae]|uniref:FAD-binding oxidoreductase n=1 Tax=Protaetiibacter larvae TaxID=2592654 RepID=A0A5C1Y6S6_9MICO|nr:FAD-binding oxidoreductase [Protaetiibacter larvae]QEO09496.1 FAD-binding oxidoreductase [Protaetiibacter larvae]
MSTSLNALHAADALAERLGDLVQLPGDPAYDAGRAAWNSAIDQRPAAVARPSSAEEVARIVRVAAELGLRVAPQSTGHAAGELARHELSDTVLIRLDRLTGVTVDPDARTARVLGGTLWQDVIAQTAPHGLTAAHGSAGDVAVAGYALSGGMSFYGRRHGLAVNAIRSVQLVTASGEIVTASHDEHAALFWAVRGGSGAFGVVTAIELELLPYPDVFAGAMFWDLARAREVVTAWRDWALTAPESVTTTLRIMHLPPLPELPPFLSGRSIVVIDGAILDGDERAAAVLAPLRKLDPEVDSFARMPAEGLLKVHMDPDHPSPSASAHVVLGELSDHAIERFVSACEAKGLLMMGELRQLGGAFGVSPALPGAVSRLEGAFALYALGAVPAPELLVPATAAARGVVDAVAPWRTGSVALTMSDGNGDGREAKFGASAERLANEARRFDPAGVFVAAHAVRG